MSEKLSDLSVEQKQTLLRQKRSATAKLQREFLAAGGIPKKGLGKGKEPDPLCLCHNRNPCPIEIELNR